MVLLREELYCSDYCKQQEYSIIGTGRKPEEDTNFGGYLLIEFPKAWDAKIEQQSGLLGEIAKALDTSGKVYRLQAIKDENSDVAGPMRFILYRWDGGCANREEYRLHGLDKLPELLSGELDPEPTDITRDILICTHAQRDKCCGRYGYPIYQTLSQEPLEGVKIWRSSHLTGHRSAPTVLDLPRGNFWGYMTTEIVSLLVRDESMSTEQVRQHFRGGTGLSPHQQVVDREGLIKYGPKWHDVPAKVSQEERQGTVFVTIQRDDMSVSGSVKKDPDVIEVGETYCGFVKEISVYHQLL